MKLPLALRLFLGIMNEDMGEHGNELEARAEADEKEKNTRPLVLIVLKFFPAVINERLGTRQKMKRKHNAFC